jgi:hypothetical protein
MTVSGRIPSAGGLFRNASSVLTSAPPAAMTPPPALAPAPAVPGQRPTGVTVFCVLQIIYASALILMGLLLTAAFTVLGSLLGPLGAMLGGSFGLIFLAFGVFGIVAAAGSLGNKPWGWTAQIVFNGLNAALGLMSIPGGFLQLAISGVLIWYYTTPEVKAYHGKTGTSF